MTPPQAGPRPSRSRGAALACSALIVLSVGAWHLALLSARAWQSVSAPGPAALDDALAAICASAALFLLVWLLAALALSLAAALIPGPSTAGALVAGSARLIAPRIMRSALAALVGVTIAAGPTTAASAARSQVAATAAGAEARASRQYLLDAELSPSWVPPSRPAATGSTSGPSTGRPSVETTGTADRATSRGDGGAVTGKAQEVEAGAAAITELLPGWVPGEPPGTGSPAERIAAAAPIGGGAQRHRANLEDSVVVRRGDTLWSLAARHLGPGATDAEIAVEWPHWFTANRSVIGGDPDHLVPGDRLSPPDLEDHPRDSRAAVRTGR